MSVDELTSRTRLLESDIKIMKSEVMRIGTYCKPVILQFRIHNTVVKFKVGLFMSSYG